MALRDRRTVWVLLALLAAAGAAGPSVIYPFTQACAVKGSTVTLPCSFTPARSTMVFGTRVPLKIVRVGWCVNHEICQDMNPSVYDSSSASNDPRYRYLGDMRGNCTLQITDIRGKDEATFRFRMEADDAAGHFTNRTGVSVRVVEGIKMSIRSSRDDGQLRGGANVVLQCSSSTCTTHQLNITWFRDGHTLSETGPALQLRPLAAGDSGNYTCGLGNDMRTLSEPYSLQVEVDPAEEGTSVMSIVRLMEFTVITVIFVIVASHVIRRMRLQDSSSEQTPDTHVEVQ